MKTELTKVYMQLRAFNGGGIWQPEPEIELNLNKKESNDTFCYGDVTEIEVALPVLTPEEKGEIMQGAELESLIAMKERLQAEMHNKLMQINERIGELQSLEYKPNYTDPDNDIPF